MSGKKPKNTGATLSRMWRFLKPQRAAILILLVLVVGSNLLSLLSPMLSGRAVDAIGTQAGGVDFPEVWRNCALMAVCYLVSGALNYFISARLVRLGQTVAHSLRSAVFDRLMELPASYFDTHPSGDIVSRICYDVDTVNTALSTDILQVCVSVVTVAGSCAMLLSISPRLCCIFLVTVPFSFLITGRQMKKLQPLYRRRSASLGELNGFAEECVTDARTARAYGVESQVSEAFSALNDEASEAYYKTDRESTVLGPSVHFVNNLSLAFISVFGALMYLAGGFTLGNLSSFVLYSRKFSGPIREAADILGDLQSAVAAAERVFQLLDERGETPDVLDAFAPERMEGAVVFDDVAFGYTPDRQVLDGFTAQVAPGSVAAVVGPTGAGKTTLVNLLMRFYDVDGGSIRVDGVDVRDYARAPLRAGFAMVLQDTWLFHGTVYENIAYGADGATREQVEAAAKAAQIDRFIRSLPQGYDTLLTDDGVNISKGQKQLLTIARAMLRPSSILILDEATSNVDTVTEGQISRAMEKLMKGKTCFVIAHRLATVQGADSILVLDGGRVAEQGTHEELLAKGGLYAAIYRAQFESAGDAETST